MRPFGFITFGQNFFNWPMGNGSLSQVEAKLSFVQSLPMASSMVSFFPGYTSLNAASALCGDTPPGPVPNTITRCVSTSSAECHTSPKSGCSKNKFILGKPSSSQNFELAWNTNLEYES